MMLAALYDLARRERLLEDPDYEKHKVDYVLRIDEDGNFVSLEPTVDEDGTAVIRLVPRLPKRTVKVTPAFLFDNAKYVLGLGREERPGRNQRCVEAFRERVAALAGATGDAGAQAVLRFLDRREQQLSRITSARGEEWTGSEWIAFVLDSDGTTPVHERSKARAYWAAQRSRKSPGSGRARCLVTGHLTEPATLHGSIKRLPGAQTSGAALVSFNASAFASYGLDQGANAPVSRAAAEGYVTALNWLLESDGLRRHRAGVSVGDDAVTVFWTREKTNTADALLSLFAPSAEQAIHVAQSPFRGLEPSELDSSPFYAVTLSGNAARVVVRDWIVTIVADVKANVRQYFADLALAGDDGRPRPLWALLKSVEAPGRELPPDLGARFVGAALRGRAFPRELIGAALRRVRLPGETNERRLLHDRIALVKATWLRLHRPQRTKEELVSLDESNTTPAYLLGRLFAVLERLQAAALGDINATIRDRYFGAASSTPSMVFPRLIRLGMHHAAKAEYPGWLEKIEGQIIGALPPQRFPAVLSLEDQGLFAIGYYHQRERFFEKKKEQ